MTRIVPAPSTHLPPIQHLSSSSLKVLLDALGYLRILYIPEIRGSRRLRSRSSARTPSAREQFLHEDALRSDPSEKAYAIRWLTALIGYCVSGQILQISHEGEAAAGADLSLGYDSESEAVEQLLRQGASLLAICAGSAAAGTLTRDISFPQSDEGGVTKDETITIRLTDVPLDNHDFSSVGAQTWGAACVLAEMIVHDPAAFGLNSIEHHESPAVVGEAESLKVLELGAGTGLVSLVVGRVLQTRNCKAHVVATDFHPAVLKNLHNNISANFHTTSVTDDQWGVTLSCCALDWSQWPYGSRHEDGAIAEMKAPLDQLFDVILGADIVYEAEHAAWIKSCLEILLRRPSPVERSMDRRCQFHLLIPSRPTHATECRTIEHIFPFANYTHASCGTGFAISTRSVLGILEKEIIFCDAYDGYCGISEDVEYVYYRIGWC